MKKLLLLLLCVSLFGTLAGQEKQPAQKRKPKIGLVLSGGGAKGLAHIGVLKVLEEAGVEISYVGGTSMGAIVGGLYAAGYSATELDSIFRDLDADALLRDFTPRGSKNFFEKRNDEMYALTLPFKNFKIGFPTAFSKGLYNYTTVNRLTDHVRNVRDFDKLPIPFVCIATDIETGEEVVLHKGVLPDAILASGAFPSLYSPVEIDGRLLIDGGVTNNYPIEEVKKMGADIIIGVDVQDPLKTRDQIKGATGVLVQINNYQMIKKMDAKRKATDIYIKPDISGFSVVSFEEGVDIIKKGEDAALKILDTLRKLGSGIPIVKPHIGIKDSLCIEQIEISGLKNYTRSYIIGKLSFKPGNKVSYDVFNNGITNLNATQNFTSIAYSFDKANAGDPEVLRLRLTETPITRFLKFGLHYDGLFKSAIVVNLTQKNFLKRNDVASLDVILGDNFRYNLDYYIDNGFYISYGLHSHYYGFNRNVSASYVADAATLLNLETINVDFTDFTNQIYIQTIFAQRFLLGGGAEYKHLKIKSPTLQNLNPVFEDSDYVSAYSYIKFDSYDNKHFPTQGYFFAAEAKAYLFSSDYTNTFNNFTTIKAEISTAKTIARHLTIELEAESGLTIGDNVATFDYILGGYGYNTFHTFRHFFGYDFVSLSGNSYLKGAATLDYEFVRKNHLNVTANYANVGSHLYREGKLISWPSYSGYAVGYGMETIIGPLEIKHSWSPETGKHYTWFSVGFWF
ncbi:patatin [Flavobacterium rivuli WB 3.3-2 = DSM 21788]|uniref:Patatin n=1 Tax=Flavobacterium rivuli WB 3.3-2 = DSM 21788 TaxID=1121895 RepID=A0A0A2LWG4_9FLAO|nr:patatin-like phospholipase family protein [Flavobacterium rivuli]KGO84667.1 patatin [Flavobacterium rivuli WB 3.3-2 = DSM 21788]